MEKDKFKHLGVTVSHDVKENTLELTMPEYTDKLQKIKISPLREKVPNDKLTPREMKEFRSLLGQLAWLAANLRPDLAAECSMMLSINLSEECDCLKQDMELYNEGLCDLLSSEKKSLQIREVDVSIKFKI